MLYNINLKLTAVQDIESVIDYVENKLFTPIAAENFFRGIYKRIAELETSANIYPKSKYQDVLKYGENAKHITYRKFVIVYTIHQSNQVVVHRIIHGSLIKN